MLAKKVSTKIKPACAVCTNNYVERKQILDTWGRFIYTHYALKKKSKAQVLKSCTVPFGYKKTLIFIQILSERDISHSNSSGNV